MCPLLPIPSLPLVRGACHPDREVTGNRTRNLLLANSRLDHRLLPLNAFRGVLWDLCSPVVGIVAVLFWSTAPFVPKPRGGQDAHEDSRATPAETISFMTSGEQTVVSGKPSVTYLLRHTD